MKRFTVFSLSILIIFLNLSCSEKNNDSKKNETSFYVANWNVENLFDAIDENGKNDEWFTPSSEINWTQDKLNMKIQNLSQVILDMNNKKGPDILGLEEVENESVLKLLVDKISFRKKYKIIHFESPDGRGIDNAIIYNSDIFSVKHSRNIEVNIGGGKTTRDIVYALFGFNDKDIHVYVNHWSSRREGLKETEPRRIKAAETLVNEISRIKDVEKSNIIILGDFNDLPSNISINKILGAKKFDCKPISFSNFGLLNLTYDDFQKGKGTYKYREHWNMLDQIIISNSLCDQSEVEYQCDSFEIIKPEYLIQQEGKYKGTSLPTYGGRKYLGGYSDHFAIGANFIVVE